MKNWPKFKERYEKDISGFVEKDLLSLHCIIKHQFDTK